MKLYWRFTYNMNGPHCIDFFGKYDIMFLTNSTSCVSMSYLIYHVVEGAQGHRNAMAFFISKNTTNDIIDNRYPDLAFRLSRTQEKQKLNDRISVQRKK